MFIPSALITLQEVSPPKLCFPSHLCPCSLDCRSAICKGGPDCYKAEAATCLICREGAYHLSGGTPYVYW